MNNIDKILKLAQKTGDKIIITNPDGSDSFVMMPFKDYEKIIAGEKDIRQLSEQELWDQINRDINLWRENNETEDPFYAQEFKSPEDYEEDYYTDEDFENEFMRDRRKELWEDEPVVKPFDDDKFEDDFIDEKYDVDDLIPDFEEDKNENEEDLNFDEDDDFNEFKKDDADAFEDFEDEEVEDENKSRFAIPKERLNQAVNQSEDEKIEYEDIDFDRDDSQVKINDITSEEDDNQEIIDMSFDEKDVPEDDF